tara:strand:+ start:415 stop:519 length:105 start_codon:yes stop_codon:yes gene_type:complete
MKIALIAHDGKKADMVDFVLKRFPLNCYYSKTID